MLLSYLFPKAIGTEPIALSIIDHLEELRWRLIRAAIVIAVFTVAAFVLMPYIFQNVILAHADTNFWTYRMMCRIDPGLCVDKINFTLQSREMAGQFTIHLKAAFMIGLMIGFPYMVWEIWNYIRPALREKELNVSGTVISVVPFLFAIGILFGYFVLAPLSVNFLANYTLDTSIMNQFDITSYVSTVTMLVLSCGMIFQLPVLIYFLAIVGIVTPDVLRKYRKQAIVVIFIVAGIITPSPDILSQVLVALPLYLLYEISVYTAVRVQNSKLKLQPVKA